MIYRRFAVISLCCILFCGHFAFGSPSGVVQAYRTPSEDDLQWLLGDTTTLIPTVASSSGVVQAGYISTPSRPALLPRTLPNPPIPTVLNGVTNATTTVGSASSIVLMSAERLPPPMEVPTEPVFSSPSEDFTRFLMPRDGELHRDVYDFFDADHGCGNRLNNDAPCVCFTCLVCGDHRKRHHNAVAPSMIGSSAWFPGFSVGTSVGADSALFSMPTMLLSRPNVAEHFNARVQNRIWADYRSWNNAVMLGDESRGVEQFSFGLERQILRNVSLELRVPVFYQFGSGDISDPKGSVELGNVSVFMKSQLLRKPRWTVSSGAGVSLPTAEDWRPFADARLKNRAYNLVSFIGVQWHPNKKLFGHFVVQHDMPVERNKLFYNGNSVKVDGQQVIRTGIQLGRWIYRTDHGKRPCRFGVFTEVNYAVITQGSGRYYLGNDAICVDRVRPTGSTLTAAVGMPFVFGNLTATNALILPISGSNRPFSVGYNFSLSRQF